MIRRERICDACEHRIAPGDEYVRVSSELLADEIGPGATSIRILASAELELHVACALEKGHLDTLGLETLRGRAATRRHDSRPR